VGGAGGGNLDLDAEACSNVWKTSTNVGQTFSTMACHRNIEGFDVFYLRNVLATLGWCLELTPGVPKFRAANNWIQNGKFYIRNKIWLKFCVSAQPNSSGLLYMATPKNRNTRFQPNLFPMSNFEFCIQLLDGRNLGIPGVTISKHYVQNMCERFLPNGGVDEAHAGKRRLSRFTWIAKLRV
jgi:hypothetical protein